MPRLVRLPLGLLRVDDVLVGDVDPGTDSGGAAGSLDQAGTAER
jgi:hypothetical protein